MNINGETAHKVCCLNCKQSNVTKDDDWDSETCLVIVDKISFASIHDLEKLNENINLLCGSAFQ